MNQLATRETVVIPSSSHPATAKASSDERIIFDNSEQRDRFERHNKYQGIQCRFNYLSSDRNGRDLYQVIRTKL
ncbi:hypothetical protein EOL70_13600 [Leucothrix sargassi]|nr:hypothetical protein EOL70_13600 [Leucothrix sargassi]